MEAGDLATVTTEILLPADRCKSYASDRKPDLPRSVTITRSRVRFQRRCFESDHTNTYVSCSYKFGNELGGGWPMAIAKLIIGATLLAAALGTRGLDAYSQQQPPRSE